MSPRPEPDQKRATNIFINYRREDSAGHAGRLFDRLSLRFPGRVFMDVDTIEPGTDFVEVIEHAVGCCEVLIVMMGDQWLSITDASGRRRLDNASDFVRLEIAAALERNIRIIPVLVEGAVMPRPEDLPEDLGKLTRRNAIELSDARWTFDVDRLIQTIEGVLQEKAPSALLPVVTAPSRPALAQVQAQAQAQERKRSRAGLVLSLLVVLALGIGWGLGRQVTRPEPKTTDSATGLASSLEPPQTSPPARELQTKVAPPTAEKTTQTTTRRVVPDKPKERKGRFGQWIDRGKAKLRGLTQKSGR